MGLATIFSPALGNDVIGGGDGNDTLQAGGGSDSINGGAGNDRLISSGAGVYLAETGNDTVLAGLGTAETLNGGAGTDWLDARSYTGAYAINLGTGATNFAGESFVNFENVLTAGGNDTLTGTLGANRMNAGTGNDQILGLGGNDTLEGAAGNDVLWGGLGNDLLQGGLGNDTLNGGGGADVLNGAAGADVFRFVALNDSAVGVGVDLINGFDGAGGAPGDRFDLSAIDANTLVAGNQAFTFHGTTNGGAGTAWVVNNGAETWLQVNVDGDAVAEMRIRIADGATLAGNYAASDFIL